MLLLVWPLLHLSFLRRGGGELLFFFLKKDQWVIRFYLYEFFFSKQYVSSIYEYQGNYLNNW